jgi:hypothetical protein
METIKCRVQGPREAGLSNVTLTTTYGRAMTMYWVCSWYCMERTSTSWQWYLGRPAVPYMFETLASVRGVYPPQGSITGGTLLTIVGSGFPPGISGGKIQVRVGGVPCALVSVVPSRIECTLPLLLSSSNSSSNNSLDAARAQHTHHVYGSSGFHAGLRGATHIRSTGQALPVDSMSVAQGDWKLNNQVHD